MSRVSGMEIWLIRKSRTTKSPLMQDWVFRLGYKCRLTIRQKINGAKYYGKAVRPIAITVH